jgi:hypothetical protein
MPKAAPYRHTSLSIANGASYRCVAFNGRGEPELGVVVRCDQALSIKLAYGRAGVDTATAEGTAPSPSLPFATPAQTFASATGAETGTYHAFEVPPHATLLQLILTNSSGSTATVDSIDYDFDSQTVTEEDAV